MIDLHLHFDGSLLPRTVLELAQEQGILLPATEPDELKLFLTAPEECGSLNEYLEKFDLPLQVLQTREAVRKAMYILISSLKEQGMLYAEIRFAPQLHTKRDMTQEQVVKAALTGMQEALAGSFLNCKLILCGQSGRRLLFWGAAWRRWIWPGPRPCIRRRISRMSSGLQRSWACPLRFTQAKPTDRRASRQPLTLGPAASATACARRRIPSCLCG